ncbi:MAG: hypothetical protein WCQ99_10135 [Pseudomonadota bacterium]
MQQRHLVYSLLLAISFTFTFLLPLQQLYGQQCPPAGYPEYTVSCPTGYCCPQSEPVCGEGIYEGYCFERGGSTTTTTGGTTTVPGGVTTTIPSNVTTTTVPGGNAGDFIVAINVNAQDSQWAEPSGILPGTSPQQKKPLAVRKDGRAIPFWYEANPPVDLELLKESRAILKKRESLTRTEKIETQLGQQKNFWVKDTNDANWRQVAATAAREGQRSIIFVDNSITVPESALNEYVAEFDTMYQIVADNIGEYIDRDGDSKVNILFYSFNDGGSISMYMAGYFWSKDYVEDSVASQQGVRSNEMDVIYIRGNEPTGWEQVGTDFYGTTLTTLIHEYQHMVNFCITAWSQQNNPNYSDTWINEMMSMASETLYYKQKIRENPGYTNTEMQGDGYLTSRLEYYNQDPQNTIRNGHGLTYWDRDGDVLSNYSQSYLFGQYLAAQASNGQGIFKDILNYMVGNQVYDYQAATAAATQKIAGISTWEDLLKSFSIANLANEPTGLHGYKGSFALTPHGPSLSSARINNGGAVYRNVTQPASAPIGAGPNIKFFDSQGNPLQKGVCASSLLLGDDSSENNLLREFRDRVLLTTDEGKTLAALYYQHTEELSLMMLSNQVIRIKAVKVLLETLPYIRASLRGDAARLSRRTAEDINEFCEAVSLEAGPGLRGAIEKFRIHLIKTFL